MSPTFRCASLALLLLVLGCAAKEPIHLAAELEPRDEKFFPLSSVLKAQAVVVTANSEGVPIDIYLVKAGTEDEAAQIVRKAAVKEIIASKVVRPNPTFEATIPADTSYGVYVVNTDRNRRARVTIKLTEQ